MCGIFGMVLEDGLVSRERRAVGAALLAAFNERRGDHSWGAGWWRNGRIESAHGLESPVFGAHTMARQWVWIGHARFATVGEKTRENAHPFRIGELLGAHNGGIYNHKEMDKAHGRNFSVDSMHLFAHLAEGKDLKELEGYGAIEYLRDGERNAVFLCRMRLGDLAVLGIEQGGRTRGVLWSSEGRDAWRVADAMGVKSFTYRMKENALVVARSTGLFETGRELELSPGYWRSECSTSYLGNGYGSESGSGRFAALADSTHHADGGKWEDRRVTGFHGDAKDDPTVDAPPSDEMVNDLVDEKDPEYTQWCDEMCYATSQYLDPADPATKRAYFEYVCQREG